MSLQPEKTSIDEPIDPSRRGAMAAAVVITAAYLALATMWMLWGEWALVHIIQIPPSGNVAAIKDWVFIVATTAMLIFVLAAFIGWVQKAKGHLETRAQLSAKNYQTIFDRNPLAMWVYEFGTNQILAANKAAMEKYGYTLEEYQRMKIIELAALKQFPRAMKLVSEFCPGMRETSRWTHRRKDGSTLEVEVISDALEYDGKRARIVIATDVTETIRNEQGQAALQEDLEKRVDERAAELSAANENLTREIETRKRMEAELVEARDEAEKASEAKSGFIASTSHEIRTPLTSILGYADLLADPELAAEGRTKYVAVLQQNASHLLRMIDDLLDLSRMEMGRMSVAFEQYSPQELAQRAVDLITPRANEKSLEFSLEYVGKIPESIRTDGGRVVQVLLNLLMNAIKFTPRGRVLLLVRGDAQNNRLWFEVNDTGIGMEHEDAERIFEPFFQVEHGANRRYGGAGLGLAISKELAGLLGGTIEVESVVGKGSTFRLGLPLEETKAQKPADAPERENAQLSGHILLADDNAVVRWLVEEYLRRAGASVTGVGDGASAVAAVKESMAGGKRIDLVLMDINMPGMDGSQAMGIIRSLGFTGPIAALTAHSTTVPQQEWMKAGWTAVAGKPIDRMHFIPMVAGLIEAGRGK